MLRGVAINSYAARSTLKSLLWPTQWTFFIITKIDILSSPYPKSFPEDVGYAKSGSSSLHFSLTNLDNFGHNPTQQDIQPIQPNPEKSTAQGAPSPLKLQPRREQRWDLHDGCIRAIISWSPHGRFLVGVGVRKSKTQSARVWKKSWWTILVSFLFVKEK